MQRMQIQITISDQYTRDNLRTYITQMYCTFVTLTPSVDKPIYFYILQFQRCASGTKLNVMRPSAGISLRRGELERDFPEIR